jgi:hypothetical protein
VEEKGYKRIIKLPDWLNKQNRMIKSSKQCAGSRIYLVISCSFHTTTMSELTWSRFSNRNILAFCGHILQGSTIQHGSTLRTWGEPGYTMTRKNAEQRTTGDKHQVPAHSTKGQKRTAKDRYKLPVGLLKRVRYRNVLRWSPWIRGRWPNLNMAWVVCIKNESGYTSHSIRVLCSWYRHFRYLANVHLQALLVFLIRLIVQITDK